MAAQDTSTVEFTKLIARLRKKLELADQVLSEREKSYMYREICQKVEASIAKDEHYEA